MDAYYVEDFLLMYRVFITDPTMIFEKLMHWFAEIILRDKVCSLLYCEEKLFYIFYSLFHTCNFSPIVNEFCFSPSINYNIS